jgi:dethiobiotin synthetase
MKQQGLFITGTDTDVGKTYVGQALVRALSQQGIKVRVRKPVESGWPIADKEHTTDAALLARAASHCDALQIVCPNRLQVAVSPTRAAALEGKTLSIAMLKQQCLVDIGSEDFLYVEGAGGFYSPLASDGLNANLAQQLALPVLLVADDKIGCINQVLLNLDAIAKYGLPVVAIVLNQITNAPKNAAMNNSEELAAYTSTPIFSYAYHQQVFPQALLSLIAPRKVSCRLD